MQPETLHAEQKYRGDIAKGYDAKREQQPKWHAENRLVEAMLADMPSGSYLLDCPFGTGRFVHFYERKGFNVTGLDINEDMLKEARKKIGSDRIQVRLGNILDIPLPPKSVDVTVSIRLFNWLAPEDVQKAFKQLQGVARQRVIFNARVREHIRARPQSLFSQALLPHWRLSRVEEIEPNYLMFMAERR